MNGSLVVKITENYNPTEVSLRVPEGVKIPADFAVKEGDVIVGLRFFEGPLELLIYLIKRHKINIFDIPMAEITERYLAYIRMLEDLNLDVAADFIAMAATLTYIKSQMLLPRRQVDDDSQDTLEGDPRKELIRQLLEYQKYRDAAERLSRKPILGKDVFVRKPQTQKRAVDSEMVDVSTEELINAFREVMERAIKRKSHTIKLDDVPVEAMVRRTVQVLRVAERIEFRKLMLLCASIGEVVATFLAILELARMRLVRLFQFRNGAEIFIEAHFDGVDVDAELIKRFDEVV